MKMHAHVLLDMDENRIALRWWVFVYDENDNLVEIRPFAKKHDAEEYAKQFGVDEEDEEHLKSCPTCGAEDSGTSCGMPNCGWITGIEE